MTKNVFFGVIAATIAPLAMTFGFILWGKSWKSSAYALNLFKCTFAATIFMLIAFSIRWTIAVTPYEESMIILSSILGIVIGDNTWLMSLQMIGAKRVIIIDTFKPLLAAVLGSWILHEPFTWTIGLGIFLSMVGIVMVSIEKTGDAESGSNEEEGGGSPQQKKPEHSFQYYCMGYLLAFINVFLDAIGSVLTKQFGTELNTWEINFLRFGFASVSMAAMAVFYSHYLNTWSSPTRDLQIKRDGFKVLSTVTELEDGETRSSSRTAVKSSAEDPNKTWYKFPHFSSMQPSDWGHVVIGICFVTFLCPALSNYALFQIPLGLCLTLTSLGPVYSIPLVYLMSQEKTGLQGMIGAVLAFAGVAIMFM